MQHAAIENSNSMAPMLTGTPFSSVSSPFHPFNQYKTNSFLQGLSGLCLGALKEYVRFIANHRCRQTGVNALHPALGCPLLWTAGITNLLDRNFLNPCCRYQFGSALLLDLRGLRGRLWLMFEVKHELKVQVQ